MNFIKILIMLIPIILISNLYQNCSPMKFSAGSKEELQLSSQSKIIIAESLEVSACKNKYKMNFKFIMDNRLAYSCSEAPRNVLSLGSICGDLGPQVFDFIHNLTSSSNNSIIENNCNDFIQVCGVRLTPFRRVQMSSNTYQLEFQSDQIPLGCSGFLDINVFDPNNQNARVHNEKLDYNFNHNQICPASGICGVNPSCQGATPTNATLCSGDDSALTFNANRALVGSCSASAKCEYTCNSGFNFNGSTCVPVTYSCQGATPTNATLCSGDDSALTFNANRALVGSCSASAKCEYTCNSGFNFNGSTCVPVTYSCQGATPTNATLCSGDDSVLTFNANRALVGSCSASAKCEYTCNSGFYLINGSCQLATCQYRINKNNFNINETITLTPTVTNLVKIQYSCNSSPRADLTTTPSTPVNLNTREIGAGTFNCNLFGIVNNSTNSEISCGSINFTVAGACNGQTTAPLFSGTTAITNNGSPVMINLTENNGTCSCQGGMNLSNSSGTLRCLTTCPSGTILYNESGVYKCGACQPMTFTGRYGSSTDPGVAIGNTCYYTGFKIQHTVCSGTDIDVSDQFTNSWGGWYQGAPNAQNYQSTQFLNFNYGAMNEPLACIWKIQNTSAQYLECKNTDGPKQVACSLGGSGSGGGGSTATGGGLSGSTLY